MADSSTIGCNDLLCNTGVRYMQRPVRITCKYCGGLGYVQDLDEKDGKPVFVRNKCPDCKGFKYKIVKS